MKKGHYTIIILAVGLVLFSGLLSIKDNDNSTKKEIVYNGNNLRVSIDGVSSNTLPTSGNYYLVNYDCKDKNTVLSWDMDNHKLNVSNGNKGKSIACYLEYKSNPKLSEMPVGSYVAYEGVGGTVGSTSVACKNGGSLSSSVETDEAESSNSCLGQNAREDLETANDVYGYCYDSGYKFITTGWRLAYIDDGKSVIVSGGSPECNARPSSNGNIDYIKLANSKALKYCNPDYVDGGCSCLDNDNDGLCDCTDSDDDGLCDEIENGEVDAWAVNDIDFYNMTKAISGVGKRLGIGSSNLGDTGGTTLYCSVNYSRKKCGYNNDLIDNGGYYWLAVRYSSSKTYGVLWNTYIRTVGNYSDTSAYGLRPVISLSSSVIVTGGTGTMDDPYVIGNNNFSINGGASYISSNDDKSNVVLKLIKTDDVEEMCISINSSVCSNYIDFNETYTLDWSSEEDGKKEVYVYYKNASDEIVASMNKSIILSTSGPGVGNISFVDGDGLSRTVNVNSKGSSYMCFSNTSNNINDCTEWVKYSKTYSLAVEQGVGNKTVYVFFKDAAGNTVGPYSATTTCTNDCEYKYFMDAYNDSNVYIVRNDGATAIASTTGTDITWYSKNTQKMNTCGVDNYYNIGVSAYIWCIGEDNNVYYKSGYKVNTWNKVNIDAYIDTSSYEYSIYPYGTTYAYVVRSDGKTNRISSTGLFYSTSWSYGYNREMAVCSGYSSSRVTCLGKDGVYYYKTSWNTTSDYTNSGISNLTNRTSENSWIDMYYNTNTGIIESDGTNLYTTRFAYNSISTIWHTSPIPGGGVEYCASGGYSTNNYCLAKDGYLYYKNYDAESWTKSSLKFE